MWISAALSCQTHVGSRTLTEVATGCALEALLELDAARVEAAVGGLPETRRHAADVAALGLRAAARDALGRADTRSDRHA